MTSEIGALKFTPVHYIIIYHIITLIERALGELIFIYSGVLLPDVSSIF